MADQEGAGESRSRDYQQPSSPPPEHSPVNWGRLSSLVKERRLDLALWVTRCLTILCTLAFVFPVFGSPRQYYYKAFMASAATSALRLHQRLPRFSFSREFFEQMVQEDSFHYLFSALVFLYGPPLTLALTPIFLFALLHISSFSLAMLDAMGRSNISIARYFKYMIEYKSVTILRFAAGAEIFIMPFVIFYTLIGRYSLVCVFMYYRFLTFRYVSRRNHYSRIMFYELRMSLEHVAALPKCPKLGSSIIHSGIRLVLKVAPAMEPAQ